MRLLTLYDILVAWQADRIGYRRAMQLAQVDTLDELYLAAHDCGVTIRLTPSSEEIAMGAIVGELIRGQAGLKSAP